MNNYKYRFNEGQLVLVGTVIYENGYPASGVNVVLQCICPLGYYYRNHPKCKKCRYRKLQCLSISKTNECGEFLFVIYNRNLIYKVVVVDNLIE